MGFAVDGGADLADVFVTASAIREGDEESWRREWEQTAQRIHGIAAECLAKGHRVSAREAFLRASSEALVWRKSFLCEVNEIAGC